MSTTTINFSFLVDDVATDATSVVLRDEANAFGVRRTDTSAAVVAAGTAMTRTAAGQYQYTFTDPAPGLNYNYWVEVVYDGATYRQERNKSASYVPPAASLSYLTVEAARAQAALLPGLAAVAAASDASLGVALELATADVDAAGPYQGRRYDPAQALEFPRVPYPSSADATRYAAPAAASDAVWDWDAEAEAAVVPVNVLRAVLYQANAICSGAADEIAGRQQAIRSGLASQSVGGMSESYRDPGQNGGRAGWSLLNVRAQAWLMRYRLRSGKLL